MQTVSESVDLLQSSLSFASPLLADNVEIIAAALYGPVETQAVGIGQTHLMHTGRNDRDMMYERCTTCGSFYRSIWVHSPS